MTLMQCKDYHAEVSKQFVFFVIPFGTLPFLYIGLQSAQFWTLGNCREDTKVGEVIDGGKNEGVFAIE